MQDDVYPQLDDHKAHTADTHKYFFYKSTPGVRIFVTTSADLNHSDTASLVVEFY